MEDGFVIEGARDGRKALERIRETSYDVITVDLKTPELDGYALLRVLERERPEVLSRVVVLTGFPKTAREQVGPHYPIVAKPFNTTELLAAIELRLGGKPRL